MPSWRSPHDSRSTFHLGKKNALLGALGLSIFAFVLQVAGSWYTGSLALLGDSAHLLTDLVSLLLSLGALLLACRPASEVRSFGFFRLEVLATFVNGILLLGVSLALAFECALRLWHPEPVRAIPLLWVAGIGLVFNLLSGWLLHRSTRDTGIELHHHHGHEHGHEESGHCHGHGHDHGHEHSHTHDHAHEGDLLRQQEHLHADRNLHSALLHVWSDALNSVAVIVGAAIVQITDFFWVDSLVGLCIALFILRWSVRVLKDSGHVLLEGTPRHVETVRLLEALRGADPRITEVEDLHVWEITSRMYAATAEVWVGEMSLNESEQLRERMHGLLHDRFGIAHVVLAIRPEPRAGA